MTDLIDKVIDIIRSEGNEVKNSEYFLEYSGLNINKSEITSSENYIAWFESDYHGCQRVKIYLNSKIYFEWEPITYNSSFACYCGYLKYHSDVLIFIYKEKHDAYIVSINKMEVRYFNYNGERYCVGKDLIYYEEYLNMNNGVIGVLSIPDLNVQPNISKEDLTALGLEIVSI